MPKQRWNIRQATAEQRRLFRRALTKHRDAESADRKRWEAFQDAIDEGVPLTAICDAAGEGASRATALRHLAKLRKPTEEQP